MIKAKQNSNGNSNKQMVNLRAYSIIFLSKIKFKSKLLPIFDRNFLDIKNKKENNSISMSHTQVNWILSIALIFRNEFVEIRPAMHKMSSIKIIFFKKNQVFVGVLYCGNRIQVNVFYLDMINISLQHFKRQLKITIKAILFYCSVSTKF